MRGIGERTPAPMRRWLELIADSLDGEVDETRYPDPLQQRVLRSAVRSAVSPDELARIKEEAAWEAARRGDREAGRAEGLATGLALLAHQFERRMRRALNDDELSVLRARLDSHGAARLGDVVFDLDADGLAAWIADPAAR